MSKPDLCRNGMVARVAAFEAREATRQDLEQKERALNALVKPCPGMCPPEYRGHWRDWHRGYGCECDVRGNLLEYQREIARLPEAIA